MVSVGSFFLLELDAEQHGLSAQTTVTVLNADLDHAVARQVAAGAEIVQERWESPVGRGARLPQPTASSSSTSSTSSTAQAATTSTPPALR